jgi:collagenase-like PrtC family protease
MPRQKRTYRVLEKAELRIAGLKAIDPTMDFGDSRNLQNVAQVIQQYRSKIDAYNTTLAVIDSYKNEMKELEKTLSDLNEKMLLGVAFKYGKDSHEYEMAGGVRKSDRIRKSRATRLRSTSEEAATKYVATV